jgi:hypothetical protein
MSKTIKRNSKDIPRVHRPGRNNVAWGMIMSGTGKGGPMRDSRDKRGRRANEWKRDQHEQG